MSRQTSARLADLCQISIGRTPPRDDARFWDTAKSSENVWLSIADLPHEVMAEIGESKEHLTDLGASRVPPVPAGTLIMSFKLSIGRTAISSRELRTNEAIAAFSQLETSVIGQRFLGHFLSSQDWNARLVGDEKMLGATLSKSKMSEIEIPLPPLDEQKRIVAKLDAVSKGTSDAISLLLIERAAVEVLWLKLLAKAIDTESHGASIKPLGEVFNTTSGGTPLKSNTEFYQGGTVPWLLSGEVGKYEITEAKNFITDVAVSSTSAKKVEANSVLVAMYGATAGQVGLLTFPSTTNQAVCCILPNESQLPRFVYYVVLDSKQRLVSQAVGNAQPNISQAKIRTLSYPLVTIEAQAEIVKRLDFLRTQIDRFLYVSHCKTRQLTDLRESIFARVFAGDL